MRKRTGTAAVFVVGVVCLLAAALLGGGERLGGEVGKGGRRPVVQAADAPARPHPRDVAGHRSSDARRTAREDLPLGAVAHGLTRTRLARRSAERFVRALLRRERAPNALAPRRLIRASATPELARFVLDGRPRMPAGAARARIVRLEVTSEARRSALAVASIVRARRATALLLRLVHRGGRWRVSDLG